MDCHAFSEISGGSWHTLYHPKQCILDIVPATVSEMSCYLLIMN